MTFSVREIKRVNINKCHNGVGDVLFREIFKEDNFQSNLEFLHETIIKPNSTIGYHLHLCNEEIYYVISGTGLMMVDGEMRRVVSGDAVITHSGSSHGLINDSDSDLKILVFQSKY